MTKNGSLGENLIFIISLPRSGSTLLQHIIAGHSTVGATAEPWVLFPAAYALRTNGLKADYDAYVGYLALTEFLQQLKDGENRYYVAIRKMALELYDAFLAEHSKQRFLDKTSRYYLILHELLQIFPEAKYVFLIRNPLAVLASFLDVMVQGNWKRFAHPGIRNDLLNGYPLIQQGIRHFGDQAIVVRYEDLVFNPEATVKRLCSQIGLDYELGMVNYGDFSVLPGKLVDPKSIHRHNKPVADYIDMWRTRFKSAQERHLAEAFLAHLGRPLIEGMGYSHDELMATISGKPKQLVPIVPWRVLLMPPEERSVFQKMYVEILCMWQKEGTFRILYHMLRKLEQKVLPSGVRQWLRRWFVKECNASVSVSYGHEVIDGGAVCKELLSGWKDAAVAQRQHAAFVPLLRQMYRGNPREDFVAVAKAVELTGLENPLVVEIGCGSGWNSEVFTYLLKRAVRYIGLDYSTAMVASAKQCYPNVPFVVGDATALPLRDGACDILVSGTVLMHLLGYREAIHESRRVTRRWCIFHTVPIAQQRPTTVLRKFAYGSAVVEIVFNVEEFLNLIENNGFVLHKALESVPHDCLSQVLGESISARTYLCEIT